MNENITLKPDCLFCKIISGDIPSKKIDESKYVFAFLDINPQAPTHILIIPKQHIISAADLDKKNIFYFKEMILFSNKISNDRGLLESGFRWVVNSGKNGGQTVDHLHLHLLGDRELGWPPG